MAKVQKEVGIKVKKVKNTKQLAKLIDQEFVKGVRRTAELLEVADTTPEVIVKTVNDMTELIAYWLAGDVTLKTQNGVEIKGDPLRTFNKMFKGLYENWKSSHEDALTPAETEE